MLSDTYQLLSEMAAAAGTVTRTSGSPVAPAEQLHPQWWRLNCLHICKGSIDVDPGVDLWECYCCKRKWHPTCALSCQDIQAGDAPEKGQQWWCDSCEFAWNSGNAQGKKDAVAEPELPVRQRKTARKATERPVAAVVRPVVNAVAGPLKSFACDMWFEATKKCPRTKCTRSYKSTWELLEHQASAHKVYTDKHRGHPCPLCKSILGHKTSLKAHMKTCKPVVPQPMEAPTDETRLLEAPATVAAPAAQ